MSFVVAIDGPAGTGKGTLASKVAKEFNLLNVDTGAMYRCVTLDLIRNNISLDNINKIEERLKQINIEQKKENDIEKFYLNGEDVTMKIREKDVNALVSQVSHIPVVRQNLVILQRKIGDKQDVVMEGRDIGTNVFPNADVKIYLDATPEERAKRRIKQNEENGIVSSYEEILENIKFRDNNDKTSKVAPLKQAEDAIYVDSSNMDIDKMCNTVFEIIRRKK